MFLRTTHLVKLKPPRRLTRVASNVPVWMSVLCASSCVCVTTTATNAFVVYSFHYEMNNDHFIIVVTII